MLKKFCIKMQVLTSITTCQSIRSQNTVVSELQAVKTAKFRMWVWPSNDVIGGHRGGYCNVLSV